MGTTVLMATHLVGGEIYYTQIGTNSYLITLKVYRDCGPDNVNDTQFDDVAHIGIYNGDVLIETLDIYISDAVITDVPITLDNPCFIVPPDLCLEEAIYETIVSLPPTSFGYDVVYQRCCRNNSIVNMINADDSGMSLYAHIPGTIQTTGDNSSPVFNNFPPVALCLGAEFIFDHAATDPDGDDLVYEFYTPMLGGGPDGNAPEWDPNNPQPNPPQPPEFDPILWAAGYSATDAISASDQFVINEDTGLITGTANQLGKYAIGVAVHEFRGGVYLNTTYRDFQYNVTLCDPNIVAAVPEQEQFCDGLSFNFFSESTNASSYYWDFGDPNSTIDFSTEENPSYTYVESGTYEIMLVANPEWPCADTAFATYEANPLLAPGIINTNFECIDDEGLFDFEALGNYTESASITWDFGPQANPQFSSDAEPQGITFSEPGTYTISLELSDFGCEDENEIEFTIPEDPIAEIVPQDVFCDGFDFDFENNSQNADSYLWDFGIEESVSDWSNQFEPSYTYPDSGTYVITLTAMAEFTCPDIDTESITIHTLLDPFFEDQGAQCFEGNSFDFFGEGTVNSYAVWDWQFGDSAIPSASSDSSPQNVTFTETGTYPVTLNISENGCVKDYTSEVLVVANPLIGYFLANAEGCPPLGVQFSDTSFAETPIYYTWNFGDGSSSNSASPVHFYENPGVYDVSLTINTYSGCVDEQTHTIENAITVYEEPEAKFTVDPPVVHILTPEVSIIDLSEGGTGCSYFIEEHGVFNECEFELEMQQAGWFEVTQFVTNELGCTDSTSRVITVEGHLFYVPNAFTPNSDGINDVFLADGTGIQDFSMVIYNRWGEVIHTSNDMSEPWLGNVNGGEYYAEAGVYNYHIIIHDLLGRPYEFVGHVNLIR